MAIKKMEIDLKVGLFVFFGVGLTALAILVLGSTDNLMMQQNHYLVHLNAVDGLVPGSKVELSGVPVGTVRSIDLDDQQRNIAVTLNVARKYETWIRGDSTAEIATQGVLGDKYVNLTRGSLDQPMLKRDAEIPQRASEGLSQFISKGDQLLVSLNSIASNLDRILKQFDTGNRSEVFFQGITSTAHNLSLATDKINHELEQMKVAAASRNLNSILQKINDGTGTLGALINDPGLYDDAKALIGGANRNRIIRNLVRQTIRKSDEADNKEPEKK